MSDVNLILLLRKGFIVRIEVTLVFVETSCPTFITFNGTRLFTAILKIRSYHFKLHIVNRRKRLLSLHISCSCFFKGLQCV